MNTSLRWGLCAWFCLVAQQADAWSKDYQTQYLLGDNDSRLSAKQNALAQIQLQAAQEAGTYIQGSTSLVNDQLEERINQVSAAVVTVAVVSERFELTASGQLRLSLAARANVDDSILKDRVRVIQQEAGKAAELQKMAQDNDHMRQQLESLAQQRQSQQPLLSALQQQQQKLAADNQQLRQQLQQLAKQRIPQPLALTTSSNVQQSLVSPENTAPDLQSWLLRLHAQWQQTPVQASVVVQRPSADGQFYDLAVQVDWQLSLKPSSPLAELCQRWTCALGYAYKAPFDDANLNSLHQQLFRPISRLAHIDDKYINHWQLLTVQAYPPKEEQQQIARFWAENPLAVRAMVAGQSFDLPLVQYDSEQGAMVIRIKGDMMTSKTTIYDSSTRTGEFICAMAYSKQRCIGDELSLFVLHKIRIAIAMMQPPLIIRADVVGL